VRILEVLRADKDLLDDITDRSTLADASDLFLESLCVKVALPQELKQDFILDILSIQKAMNFFVKHSRNYAKFLRLTYNRHPCTPENPWHIVMYNDEACPGAVMRQDNRRKVMGFYLTFREYGQQAIHHDAAWFPYAIVRTTIMKQIPGKGSALVKCLMRQLLMSANNVRNGFDVEIDGDAFLIFLVVSNTLYDEAACKASWSIKGATGLVSCFYCKKTTKDRSILEHDTSGEIVHISCPDPRRFDSRSDRDFWFQADLLAMLSVTLNVGNFKEQETIMGLTYNPNGLLWDKDLRGHIRPTAVQTYDPMHCLVSDGICQKELNLVLQRVLDNGVTIERIRATFDRDWHFCACQGGGRAKASYIYIYIYICTRTCLR